MKNLKNLLISALITISIFGCGAKKKTTFREKQSAIVVRANDVTVNSDTRITAKTIRTSKKRVYTPVKSDRPLVIEDESGNTTKIYNAKVEISDVQEQIDSVKKQKRHTVDRSAEEIKTETKSRQTNTKILRTNPFVAAGIGVGLLIIIVLLYRKYFL